MKIKRPEQQRTTTTNRQRTPAGRAGGIAERVIRQAGREKPADALLREALRQQHGIDAKEAAEVSHAVFAYFRWLGWLSKAEPLRRQIENALDLARRFAREPQSFPDEELIARAVPDWVREALEATAAWARALQTEPRLWLRARRGQGPALAKKLRHARPFGKGALADALEYVGREDLFRMPEFHTGEFELQDLSSQAVGLICAPKPGETWWDACAGEGGKLLHLSDLMENRGLIWASDRADWRLQRLKRRAARAKVFNYRVAPWDGGPKLPTRTKFDGVLVDAPCTGTGTWQRNPHARWTTTRDDVRELAEVQRQLLTRSSAAVKPGGKLVYAVCTLTRAETREVAQAFESHAPDFAPLSIPNPLVAGSPALPRVEIRPQDFGANGMFVAAWQKRPA